MNLAHAQEVADTIGRVQDLAGILLAGRDEHRIVGRRIREDKLDLPREADFGSHV